MVHRSEVYAKNAARVDAHNAAYVRGEETWTMRANFLADLTSTEVRQRYKNRRVKPQISALAKRKHFIPMVNPPTAPPSSWDWRDNGYTLKPKDQGDCGSCWTYGPTASIEGAVLINSGTLNSLSEQLCVDCATASDGCDGGDPGDCFDEIIKLGGDMLEKDYPTTHKDGSKCKYKADRAVVAVAGYTQTAVGDEAQLLNASYATVVSISIDAEDDFDLYDSGVFNSKQCTSKEGDLNHVVTLVGYGHAAQGGDFWEVRNSWGTDWGMKGHIMMSRNKKNQCGIADEAMFAIIH